MMNIFFETSPVFSGMNETFISSSAPDSIFKDMGSTKNGLKSKTNTTYFMVSNFTEAWQFPMFLTPTNFLLTTFTGTSSKQISSGNSRTALGPIQNTGTENSSLSVTHIRSCR